MKRTGELTNKRTVQNGMECSRQSSLHVLKQKRFKKEKKPKKLFTMYNIDTTASCNVLFLLLTALGRKVMKSVVSVCPFVFILPFELVDFWRWFFACVWVITITRRGLKIKIIHVGQGQRLGCIYYIRLARTVTWSVWPRSSIETSLPDCVFTWKNNLAEPNRRILDYNTSPVYAGASLPAIFQCQRSV